MPSWTWPASPARRPRSRRASVPSPARPWAGTPGSSSVPTGRARSGASSCSCARSGPPCGPPEDRRATDLSEITLGRTVTIAIFAASYLGLAVGRLPGFRVDRTGIAIVGGTLMVLTGALPWNDAVLAVDAHTLVLLFGMMI